ncbi:hypothetical protein ACWDFL_10710 [Streptomyces bungoensis]
MPDAKEDEILKKVGEVQRGVDDVKTLVSPSTTATSKQLEEKTSRILKAIKEGPETNKGILESLFESLGLKDLFAAVKDGGQWYSKVTLALGVAVTLILGKLFDFGKLFNAAFEKLSRRFANRNRTPTDPQRPGRVLAIGDNGLPRSMTRSQMDALNAVSINPHGLSQQSIAELQSALQGLTPEIRLFNSAANDMKSASTIRKIAAAIEELKNKLNPNPKDDIKDVATAIGQLHDKLTPFDHDKLPKPRALRDISEAAKDLHRNAENVRKMFQELATASTGAANSIAP